MKYLNLKKFDFKIKFFKKYNYNIDEIIGVYGENKFILYNKKKLIRIYRNSLTSKALLSSYIPIDQAIFYSFEIEKNVLQKINLENYIETKIYEEAGIEETEKYFIKYKIVDALKDEKFVIIETIIVPYSYLENGYQNIIEQTGYIDYISFPAFAYKALYDEKVLKKANDLFIVFLYDKIFLTFYHNGELLSIVTVLGGLDKLYESLGKLKIKNFDIEIFKKIIQKKGLSDIKYTKNEIVVLNTIKDLFLSMINIISSQLEKIYLKYNIEEIDRIYVTSEYGNIDGLQDYIQKIIGIDTFGFEFYEDYNLDRLEIDPFLFLGMLETYVAYKNKNQEYNFSLFLRKPTFLYRPIGRLFLILLITLISVSIYPSYLFYNGYRYNNENKKLQIKIKKYTKKIAIMNRVMKKLKADEKKLKKKNLIYLNSIKESKNFINQIYEFKKNYIPKSNSLTDITILMNKNSVYLSFLNYENGEYKLNVFSFDVAKISNLIDRLIKNGFQVSTDGVKYINGKYKSVIRIKE